MSFDQRRAAVVTAGFGAAPRSRWPVTYSPQRLVAKVERVRDSGQSRRCDQRR